MLVYILRPVSNFHKPLYEKMLTFLYKLLNIWSDCRDSVCLDVIRSECNQAIRQYPYCPFLIQSSMVWIIHYANALSFLIAITIKQYHIYTKLFFQILVEFYIRVTSPLGSAENTFYLLFLTTTKTWFLVTC